MVMSGGPEGPNGVEKRVEEALKQSNRECAEFRAKWRAMRSSDAERMFTVIARDPRRNQVVIPRTVIRINHEEAIISARGQETKLRARNFFPELLKLFANLPVDEVAFSFRENGNGQMVQERDALQGELAEAHERARRLDAQLVEKQVQIERLNAEITSLHVRMRELVEANEALGDENNRLTDALSGLENEIELLREDARLEMLAETPEGDEAATEDAQERAGLRIERKRELSPEYDKLVYEQARKRFIDVERDRRAILGLNSAKDAMKQLEDALIDHDWIRSSTLKLSGRLRGYNARMYDTSLRSVTGVAAEDIGREVMLPTIELTVDFDVRRKELGGLQLAAIEAAALVGEAHILMSVKRENPLGHALHEIGAQKLILKIMRGRGDKKISLVDIISPLLTNSEARELLRQKGLIP